MFSADDKVEFIKAAHKAGFFIRVFFVCTSEPSINITRVGRRVLEGGHEVPMNKIISRYYKSIANCVTVAPLVDRLYFYDGLQHNGRFVDLKESTWVRISKQWLVHRIGAACHAACAQTVRQIASHFPKTSPQLRG